MVALNDNQNRVFFQQLHRRKDVLGLYIVGRGEYVIIPPRLQRLLASIKRLNALPFEKRLPILRHPHSYLRESLAEWSDEEFESLVVDLESLSERVSHVGEWVGVAVPPSPPSGVKWITDRVPLVIAGNVVMIPILELPLLRERVRLAIAAHESEVDVDREKIPATPEVVAAIEELIAFFEVARTVTAHSSATKGSFNRTLAIHILDNVNWNIFRAKLKVRSRIGIRQSMATTPLLVHQKMGLSWLGESWEAGWPGVILADDMGLGKTLQALLFAAALRESAHSKGTVARILVVAPTGLLANWREEMRRHGLDEALGEPLDVAMMRGMSIAQLNERIRKAPWVLVSYERLRDHLFAFAPIQWNLVIFDEAQRIKNPASRVTNAAKALKSDFFLALTATPVENSLTDLWCIADAVAPGSLGSLTGFLRWCEVDENLDQLGEKLFCSRDGLPPFILRRLKTESLAGLPLKQVVVCRQSMPDVQAAAYARVREENRKISGRQGILKTIQQFRLVSLHPLPESWNGSDREFIDASARLIALVRFLDEIAVREEKALVYLDSLHVQRRLVGVLQRRYDLPEPPLVINGQVEGSDRLKRIDVFQQSEGFNVMLLSPRAGGLGFNFLGANHVIHLARWWNPAVEDQCTDRVFRIGQEKPVFVYYPLAIHPGLGAASFDERLEELLTRKRMLAARALAPVVPTMEELAGLIR